MYSTLPVACISTQGVCEKASKRGADKSMNWWLLTISPSQTILRLLRAGGQTLLLMAAGVPESLERRTLGRY
ncbi:MAG: hypothetical protein EF812_01090 [Methanosarcinales archaeon]|nr:MAG: hypothetical protein EF812_01090 [Methanosarcinales archaeon]